MRDGCEMSCAVSTALMPSRGLGVLEEGAGVRGLDPDDCSAGGALEEALSSLLCDEDGGIPVNADIQLENILLFPC